MSLALEQDLLVGAVLVEILRQHPEIKLNSEFVDAVVVMSERLCEIFPLETE
ncbi:MAG: hypothetical protein E6X23_17990 [Mixta calida]|nr:MULTISPECIES: hypothetical protein [Mixta]MBS6059899.1 hypothetical protein [Pantoea sp.]MCR1567218.1 hypothetical protein [Mixta sp.]MDU3077860.1 hypothetical protein [Mixta calida]MDU3818514.1 hypothetical protein [Pantoea sp.]MDU4290982.1 hypothetical protein [Mixta calida]